MECEICRNNKSKRTISGISMCEDCFSKISALSEYYVAAGPPVRRGESHPSGQTEPPCY